MGQNIKKNFKKKIIIFMPSIEGGGVKRKKSIYCNKSFSYKN